MFIYDKNNNLVTVSNSILKHFTGKNLNNTNKHLDLILSKKKYDKIVVMLFDGLGKSIREKHLSQNDFLRKKEKGGKMPDLGGVAPIIILMTDGMPTSYDWEDHLKDLKKKGWFKVALKYALAIGIDSDEAMDVLTKFTGNSETVLKVYTAEALRKVIKVIAITASKIKSNSSSSSNSQDAVNTNEIAKEDIKEKLEDIPDVEW